MKKGMMKKACLLLAFLLTVGILAGCNKKDKLPDGACYVITVEKVDAQGEYPYSMTLVYDKNGNLLRLQDDGKQIDYTYDERGNVLTCRGYNLQTNVPLDVIDYTYDEKGRLVKKEGYYITETTDDYCTTYHYDDQGNLINRKYYDGNGNLRREKTYSPSGYLVESVDYIRDLRYRYTYTQDGKLLQETRERKDQPLNIRDYIYSNRGSLVKMKEVFWQHGKQKSYTCEYTYDRHGNLERKTVITPGESGITKKHYYYTYDKAGNILSYLCTVGGITTGYRWEYDSHGNMTACHYVGKNASYSDINRWTYDEAGNVILWEGYNTYQLTYTWPEGEMPQAVKDSVAQHVAELVELDRHTTEIHVGDLYDRMNWNRFP